MSAVAAERSLSTRSQALEYARRYGIGIVFAALIVILAATIADLLLDGIGVERSTRL